ncbi:MAG: zf-HC2 domain-containing protein [Deltaproteobacteria bacterium]|nr:zf-HC2 domain-containing protein [Deltaproteobacteria bacterium]MBT6435696.1 zf-HC2 domain-containing protein [Deltaproteobacteria bacterium]
MMNCKSTTQLLSQAQDRKLTMREKGGVTLHTIMCKGCRNYGKQVQQLSNLSKQFVEPVNLADKDKGGS